MPVISGKDINGPFMKWGDSGKKYYYKPGSKRSRNVARKKAIKQGIAIGDFFSANERLCQIIKFLKKDDTSGTKRDSNKDS